VRCRNRQAGIVSRTTRHAGTPWYSQRVIIRTPRLPVLSYIPFPCLGGKAPSLIAGSIFFAMEAAIASNPVSASAIIISHGFREKIRKNPLPFTNAEKLETQNGIRNNRNIDHRSILALAFPVLALKYSAKPMIALSPSEVAQSCGFGSKYRITTTTYQEK
jgi:hypothetical protein